MIETDLRTFLLAQPAISTAIGTRFYLEAPIDEPTQTYITFNRGNKKRDMVSEGNVFQIWVFSQDLLERAQLSNLIIEALEGEVYLNGNHYHKNSFVNQTDGRVKLDNGFFWSLLTFEFQHTT